MRKLFIVALVFAALLAPGAKAAHGPDDHPVAAPVPSATSVGFAWRDAGIGAGVTAGVLLVAGCGLVAVVARRGGPARA